ncbi:SLC18B1 [Bugula neritina]|uniref:SLC18B1 n=1 Tax=Bugula neritina TaxID=10212 RepID=A0A7J7KDP4_BUGNE|nr:SLC18B1 [Bugula neritina]
MSLLLKATPFQTGTIASSVGASMNLGFTLGPAVGAILFQFGGYTVCFYFFGGSVAILTAIQIAVLPNAGKTFKYCHYIISTL